MYYLEWKQGRLKPNKAYYELVLKTFYHGKVRQHGKPRKGTKIKI